MVRAFDEGSEAANRAGEFEICPHCGGQLVSHQDYCDHLTQKNCPAAKTEGARVYPDWRESPDGPFD